MRVSYGYANVLLAALALAVSSGKGGLATSGVSFLRLRDRDMGQVGMLGMGGTGGDVHQEWMGVSGIDRLHLITVTGHGHGGVGEVKRGEDGSGGGGGGEYGSALGAGRIVISTDGIDGGGKDGLRNAVEDAPQLLCGGKPEDEEDDKPKCKKVREVGTVQLLQELEMQEQEQAGKEQSFKMLPHATVCTKDCAVAIVDTDINMLGKEEEAGYFDPVAIAIQNKALRMIGSTDTITIFLFILTLVLCSTWTWIIRAKAKANTNENPEKKKNTKFTMRVSYGYGHFHRHRNHFLQMAFYLLIVVNTATSDCPGYVTGSEFAWQSCVESYRDWCDVKYDTQATQSCICSGGIGYFVCTDKCGEQPHKVSGMCVECHAGYIFGYIAVEEPQVDCPQNDGQSCACKVTTYTPSTSSTWSNTIWPFQYVCNHDANDGANPLNLQDYDNDGQTCNPCPPGTFSIQGDIVCNPCPTGSYNDQWGSGTCTTCKVGHISASSGSTACLTCPAGTFQNTATECAPCQAGYYSPSASTECFNCAPGTFQSQERQGGCIDAQIGWYVGTTNDFSPHTQQYPCPVGSYSESEGQPHCTSCPNGFSTNETGSTSPDDCVKCQYGVDANTFACRDASENNTDNICWDTSQLLSLNASSAVDDLYNLIYSPKDVGINDLINGAMSVIQGAANGTSSIQDIQRVVGNLKNATENWLDYLQSNFSSCVDATSQEINSIVQDSSAISFNTNLFQYQFGDNYAQNRTEWIAHWKCSGATFGCSLDNSNCPQARTCFDPLYKYFGSILSFPGGTPFGNYDELSTGRYTPMYSPDFIASQLKANVASLVQWSNTAESFKMYATLLNTIQESAASEEAFTANAIDALLQVQNVSTSVSTESSYTEGSLYYEQALYNYNETFNNAKIVQWGPAYCPSGCDINPDGIPPCCSDYNTLVQECQKEIKWDEAIKAIGDTMKLCAGLVAPSDKEGSFMKGLGGLAKAFNSIGNLATTGLTLSQQTWALGVLWNPNKKLPPLPNSTSNGAFGNPEYANASYSWYLSGQQNLSQSLISMSSAFWQSIYLENEKEIEPTLQNPPNCPNYKSKIVTALNGYLANVKNMSGFGDAMTAAEMNLVPAMGNIATGIATQEAIVTANEEISAMITPSTPSIQTAPISYQGVYTTLFYTTYPDKAKPLLAYGPSASCVQNQYVAAKSIFGFCISYSYMNAGQEYVSTYDGNTANCTGFGNLYLPTYTSFQDTVSSFVSGSTSLQFETPSSVDQLNNDIVGFAANVQSNPAAVGGASGYGEVGWNTPEPFALLFSLNGTNDNATSSVNYYEDPETGTIRFTLVPSSDLLLQSTSPFSINDANPRVINVQMYLKGVTSQYGEFVKMSMNPTSPYMLYPDPSGVGTAYTLPPYNSGDGNVFATFESIEGTCATTDQTTLLTHWMNGVALEFCIDYSSDSQVQEPYTGIQNSAFAFPSLFATWTWQLDTNIWDNDYYTVDKDELQLQIVFQYVSSLSPSEGSPIDCAEGCGVSFDSDDNKSPLLGRQWCDRSECGDCAASLSSVNSESFCLCNVWTGVHETCTPSVVTSGTFTVDAVPSGSGARKLKSRDNNKEEKKKNIRGTKGAKSEAKADKSTTMPEIESLQEMLGFYLVQCDIYSNGFLQTDTVVMKDCKKKKGKSSFSCDFHVTITSYDGNESNIQEEAHDCIMATLANQDVMQDIMDVTGLCDVMIRFDRKKVFEYDACGIFT